MTADWRMDCDVQAQLVAGFEPVLGAGAFQRQVRRFIEHHVELGTVDTQAGFSLSLANWLKRADANREGQPKVNGAGAANGHVNGADPPAGTPSNYGQDIWKIGGQAVSAYDKFLKKNGLKKLNNLE